MIVRSRSSRLCDYAKCAAGYRTINDEILHMLILVRNIFCSDLHLIRTYVIFVARIAYPVNFHKSISSFNIERILLYWGISA